MTITDDNNAASPVIDATSYYPFGLIMKAIGKEGAGGLQNKFKYNWKEKQDKEFSEGSGLELYDYGKRLLDLRRQHLLHHHVLSLKHHHMLQHQLAIHFDLLYHQLMFRLLETVYLIDIQININDKGEFTSVSFGGKIFTVGDWNKAQTSKPSGPLPREDKDKQ